MMEEILDFISSALEFIVWFILTIIIMTFLAVTCPLWVIPYIIYRKVKY